jgi:DNA mismatch endonuclease Vsr
MADIFDRQTRRRIMRAVKTARTEPEERLASTLRVLRLRFRRNDTKVLGRPDFVFRRAKLAVFVDGDFWHGRAWIEGRRAPATNAQFWIEKFERNQRRDQFVNRRLRRAGWSVLRVWASDVRREPAACIARILARLRRLDS